jgi:predicted RNA binding protein YcfA (HicA-like mRNA interferase family)
VVKQRDLLKRMAEIAAEHGAIWTLHREGAKHAIYRMNTTKIAIPRHREIGEGLAAEIIRQATKAAKE